VAEIKKVFVIKKDLKNGKSPLPYATATPENTTSGGSAGSDGRISQGNHSHPHPTTVVNSNGGTLVFWAGVKEDLPAARDSSTLYFAI
jgi:hypothetical protein